MPIIVIQEAGLDGFWIHRVLQQEGIEGHVVDPASIATSRRRIKTYAFEPRATANRLPRPVDSGQLNREHPFLFAQLQSSNDGTILIGSGGRGSCELCHLNSPRGLAINQGYSTPGRRSLA
jgi:hypothetical protein